MKSAGKARSNGLYRHIRTSKEIIRNLLNDYIEIYEVTWQYEVDSVVIMHGYYSEWGDLFKIRNGGIVESIL